MRAYRRPPRKARMRTGALLAFLLFGSAGPAGAADPPVTSGPRSVAEPAATRPAPGSSGIPPAASTPTVRRTTDVAPGGQLWVWSFTDPAVLVQRARQSGLTTLLIWVSPGFTGNPATMTRLRRLAVIARSAGVLVYALGGDPSWAIHPSIAGAWATEVASSGLFGGVHVDIEPHALPSWPRDQLALSRGLLLALDEVRRSATPLQVDIPSWYDTVSVDGQPLDRAVLSRVDSVTIMAYRNSAAGVLNAAKAEVADAAGAGRPAYVGINIAAPGPDGALTTFLGRAPASVQAAVDAIVTTARSWPGFAGIAVEDSDYLLRLDATQPLTFGPPAK